VTSTHANRIVRASAEYVWELWTDRSALASWLFVDAGESRLEEGNEFRWTATLRTDRPMIFTGTVLQAKRARHLRLSWDLDVSGTTSTVDIEIKPLGDDAEVAITHDGLPESDLGLFEANGFSYYWPDHLDRLAAHAERRAPSHHHELHIGPHFVGGHPALGLLVRGVAVGSPAYVAGMRAGDILRTLDGVPVREIPDCDQWLMSRAYGDVASFGLARGNFSAKLVPPPWTPSAPQADVGE